MTWVQPVRRVALVIVACLMGCSRGARPVDRFAILPFENLTGDSSLDWIASTAPAIVAADLAGVSREFAQPAQTRSDAYLARATRFVQGYFTGHSGALRFEVEVEDTSRHKIVGEEGGTGDLLDAINTIAKKLEPSAHAFSTSNAEAVVAWGHRAFERAVTLDPDFGAAWLAWADTLALRGETAQAVEVANRALARPALRSNVDRARIELLLATLRRDPVARDQALSALTRVLPADASLLEAMASAEVNARRFSSAVEVFKSILKLDPENAGVMNSLGYAQVYAGDLDAAVKTFDAYGKLADQKTNALDSLGEAYFMNGRFKEAEKYFVQAYESNRGFLGGADLFKAAYAHWLGGDLKGADELMKRYLDSRRNDPLRAWRIASWDYATGREAEAATALHASSDVNLIVRQTEAWQRPTDLLPPDPALPTGELEKLKQAFEHTPPSSDGQARVFYAAALAYEGRKDEARKLLARWPLPSESGGDPLRESMVFPKFIETRRAVGAPVR